MKKNVEIILGDGKNFLPCPLCGDSFSWKRSTGIRYKYKYKGKVRVRGFIICEDCFEVSNFQQIYEAKSYYEKLWNQKIDLFYPIQSTMGKIKVFNEN